MTFKIENWNRRGRGLDEAQRQLEAYRIDPSDPESLDRALWEIWRAAEYVTNSLLELAGERADRGHDLGRSVELLRDRKFIEGDYAEVLGQLEEYRKEVDYGSYARSRSVHYSARNVRDCLEVVRQLREEAGTRLKEHGKL